MASPLVSDTLWSIIEPLLPDAVPRPRGGRPRVPDRAALTGILFVLRTGIQWEMLPLEMGCGSGITCWRRLRDWQAAGVWDRLHRELLRRLRAADRINWSRACIDSASLAANVWPAPSASSFGDPVRQSASTYPVSGQDPGQDGDPRVPRLIKGPASSAILRQRLVEHRSTVRPSRFHHPQTSYRP